MNTEVYNKLSEEDKADYNRYCFPDDYSHLTIDSVILSDENKGKLNEFLNETKYKQKFMSYGLKPINRLLLYGASGTGKTFMTCCLASHLGYEMLAVDIAKSLSTGSAAVALEGVFNLGNKIGNAIIFLDECDAIARDRSDKSVPEDPNVRRANNALFQLLDRMNPACIFISATNLVNELDTAFVRRFNQSMQFHRPELKELESTIRKFMLDKFELEMDMQQDIKDIVLYHAKEYTGLSYDGIETWVERAEKLAIMRGEEVIKESEIYKYFMDALHVKACWDSDRGCYYLYKIAG